MRELEFLPEWYPQLRRRRRLVMVQGWVLIGLIVGIGMWTIAANRAVRKDEAKLVRLDAELSLSRAELEQLDELLALEKQLGKQEQILAKVGSHVEAARLLATLDEVMPPEMALVDLTFDTEDRVVPVTAPPGSRLSRAAAAAPPVIDRRLKVRLVGVAPTDVDLANFLARLTAKPFFEAIAMTYAKDRSDQGHLMREFEVLFSMDLNDHPGS
jgi:Tfp pilus assembly protein PilN